MTFLYLIIYMMIVKGSDWICTMKPQSVHVKVKLQSRKSGISFSLGWSGKWFILKTLLIAFIVLLADSAASISELQREEISKDFSRRRHSKIKIIHLLTQGIDRVCPSFEQAMLNDTASAMR